MAPLLVPSSGNDPRRLVADHGRLYCDNAAFGGFDAARFRRMLMKVAPCPPEWVAVPDVVGDAEATTARWHEWAPQVPYRKAFVVQDGCRWVPWDEIAAVFLGGTTAFKESHAARVLVREAKRRGKWAHMGRVNSRRRVLIAQMWGCDSVDGTYCSRWPDQGIPRMLHWIDFATRQGRLPWAC